MISPIVKYALTQCKLGPSLLRQDMTRIQVLDKITHVAQWTRGAERAPHKPLLLLLALARCARGESREIAYRDLDPSLYDLLQEFGPSRKSLHPEYPIWHLQNDGIWMVRDAHILERRASNSNVSRTEFRRVNPQVGFTEEIHAALRRDRGLLAEAARRILAANFPSTLHEDILAAVGLDLDIEMVATRHAMRDAEFRERVLRAYERRCAICGFDVRLRNVSVALEAAHIKWHQAGGPAVESNGLALCSMHHKLLDHGAFTVSADYRLIVSQETSGSAGIQEHLMRFHGESIREPQDSNFRPRTEYLAWHHQQVFKAPPRPY